ncbi:MAG: dehydrogenase [Sulfobacillus thermosulfidooxidans]|uniref:Dehydrogenase n=1 Tax=Sulfobacillus thermotolerans TaxID=338644 RepID=A0ABN5H4P5_9FIRM|nr:dehydrogenase [Sulfobacillus sp. hq2]AUW94458.1 dehydrogenase [Sulfobacillus thermotolerans]MCY0908233.1 dehydrogenase [Sulfobacillus thermotolerans]POB09251.1 dehydrogenase [Sulfobacillus sp. hq2]PSR37023.1 MAG: dehydrogenase [Sulfobacillus thermosulfidooxidans]
MDEIDVIAIGSMPAHEREVAMGKMFEKLMEMPESEQMSAFEALIGQMAEKGTDEQYRNLCLTNLKLAAGLPDSALKPFLMMRMKAASHLSPPLAQRDMKMLQEALEQSDPAIKEKIAQNM